VEAYRVVRRRGSHRWWWGCQPYALAALYPPGRLQVLNKVAGFQLLLTEYWISGLCPSSHIVKNTAFRMYVSFQEDTLVVKSCPNFEYCLLASLPPNWANKCWSELGWLVLVSLTASCTDSFLWCMKYCHWGVMLWFLQSIHIYIIYQHYLVYNYNSATWFDPVGHPQDMIHSFWCDCSYFLFL
jgi:hypothetical protein